MSSAHRSSLSELLLIRPPDLGISREDAVGVFLVDIDRFRSVRDALGYAVGDQLLQVVELRMRAWAGARAVVAHIGASSFAAIVPGIGPAERAATEADRLHLILAEPSHIGAETVTRDVSIGFAVGRPAEVDTAGLFRQATDALDAAHEAVGSAVRGYNDHLREQALARAQIDLHLGDAIRENRLHLDFQPEVDLRTGAVLAVEALVRWKHPVLGLLGADSFVNVAERSGLISEVGTWVLREACRQVTEWGRAYPGRRLDLRVNMSPSQLAHPDTPSLVAAVLAEYGLASTRLCIEMTELIATAEDDRTAHVLRELRESGVAIAIDDFGVGFNSLLRLKLLPLDVVKIDRAFVTDLASDAVDLALVSAVVRLAAALELTVVAEGVESAAGARELLRLGCWRAQGDWLAPAGSPRAIAALLADGTVKSVAAMHAGTGEPAE